MRSRIEAITSKKKKSFICAVWIIAFGVTLFLISRLDIVSTTPITLKAIKKKGKITVVTQNNAHCYYMYKDSPMGFEYELAKAFADYLGVTLTIRITDSWDKMADSLNRGRAAFAAANLTNSNARSKNVAFSDGYMKIQHVIIVNHKNRWLNTPKELSGRDVYVQRGSSYEERLLELKKKGINFNLHTLNDVPTEELIQKVADETIDITITNNNVGMLLRRYYPKAVISGPIGEKQFISWAVHPQSKELLAEVNNFFRTIRANGIFAEIYNRYYGDIQSFDYVDLQMFHKRMKSQLPKFLPIIKKMATKYDLDWRLIAAQIYQESHFKIWAKSYAGAHGLMQLTEPTAKGLKISDIYDPAENIEGGTKYLRQLIRYFKNVDEADRLWVSLAAYNVGMGHMEDAMALAKKKGLNPKKWQSLSKMLPLLSLKKYYQNTKYGYCRGKEPVQYVKQIRVYYDILKQQAIEYRFRTSKSWIKRFEEQFGVTKKSE